MSHLSCEFKYLYLKKKNVCKKFVRGKISGKFEHIYTRMIFLNKGSLKTSKLSLSTLTFLIYKKQLTNVNNKRHDIILELNCEIS